MNSHRGVDSERVLVQHLDRGTETLEHFAHDVHI